MSEVRGEYTRETYPSFGKKYNGEKAIISLTSWKARINTVSKTLYSLIQQCPGFHIVLVLSEEEFPKMCEELPENLMLFVENEMIELLWIYRNYKSFKKVLFTMDKYRDVPVISADDDCIYTCNYAQELYDKWLENKSFCISMSNSFGSGFGILFPTFLDFKPYLNKVFQRTFNDDLFYKTFNDDLFYKTLCGKIKIKIWYLHTREHCCKNSVIFSNSIRPLNTKLNNYRDNKIIKSAIK